jgi:hypothetical protein
LARVSGQKQRLTAKDAKVSQRARRRPDRREAPLSHNEAVTVDGDDISLPHRFIVKIVGRACAAEKSFASLGETFASFAAKRFRAGEVLPAKCYM